VAHTITCTRCGREAPGLEQPPMIPAAQARDVYEKVCADCWQEWQNMEVMVINELRLNFMDPEAQKILDRQMREFLALDSPGSPTEPSLPTKEKNEAGGASS
jgi:Fe-S cluster biosynthesis and repair protein YggX